MKLTLTYKPQKLGLSYSPPTLKLTTGTPVVKEYIEVETYTGTYVVTPSDETQTLDTTDKRMAQPVVINPIPSNWGRISWNGAGTAITVS